MKLGKNYKKILCSVFFCFALGIVGCSNGDPTASSGGDVSSNTSLAPDEFVVKFDTKGGTEVAQQVIKAGNTVAKPQDPTQQYYTFTGWYWDFEEVTPFDFEGTTIASDTTIYAGWTPDHSASGLDNEPVGGGGGGGGGSETTTTVTFEIDRNAGYGKRLYIAGTFNSWEISNTWKLDLKSGSDTTWTGSFTLPTGQVEFKFVISDWNGPTSDKIWEGGSNHPLNVTVGMGTQTITWQY